MLKMFLDIRNLSVCNLYASVTTCNLTFDISSFICLFIYVCYLCGCFIYRLRIGV